jgi:UDP-N-acetylglucosamine transferase subunit ALG13
MQGALAVTTFVSVGNALQPFSRLLAEVARIRDRLPHPILVQHGHTPFHTAGCEQRAFIAPGEYTHQMRNAQVLILHAGAGSVLHAIGAGRIPVVMPRLQRHGEHVNDHQLAFARQLAKMGRVELAEEVAHLETAVARARERAAGAVSAVSGNNALIEDLRRVFAEYDRQFTKN